MLDRRSYVDTQKENLSSSVRYVESIRQEFVRLVGSRAKGELVLVRLVLGIKLAGHRLSGTKLSETKASPHPFGTRNQVGGTSSIRYDVARKEGFSSNQMDEEKPSFRAKGGLVLVRPVR